MSKYSKEHIDGSRRCAMAKIGLLIAALALVGSLTVYTSTSQATNDCAVSAGVAQYQGAHGIQFIVGTPDDDTIACSASVGPRTIEGLGGNDTIDCSTCTSGHYVDGG